MNVIYEEMNNLNEDNETLLEDLLIEFFGEDARDTLMATLKKQHDKMRYPTYLSVTYRDIVVKKSIVWHGNLAVQVMLDALRDLTTECIEMVKCADELSTDNGTAHFIGKKGIEDNNLPEE